MSASILTSRGQVLQATLYDASGHDREVDVSKELVDGLTDSHLLWIDVEGGISDVKSLETLLDLPGRVLERVTDLQRPPYLDNYTGFHAYAVDAPDEKDGKGRAGVQLGFVVGDRFLLTVHNGPVPYLTEFKAQDKGETLIGRLSPALLAASLLDWHLTQYFAAVADIGAAADDLDATILAEGMERDVLDRIVSIRGEVSRLRRQLATQRPIFYGFARSDFALNFDDTARATYLKLAQRYDRAIDEVEHSREVVVGSFDLFTSITTHQTNKLVKALTFLTALIGFCGLVAALLGMNFDFQFLHTGIQGFSVVVALMLVLSIAGLIFAKWRRWL